MSEGIFYLDEERGREAASRSPSPAPENKETRSAPQHGAQSTTSSTDKPTSLQIPVSLPNLVAPTPQPFTPALARKHTAPFAATPSFPSPLAQAITVPSHSDTSSSSSHSDDETDNDRLTLPDSPTHSGGSKTPRKSSDLVLRPRTTSPRRPLSPAGNRKTTPPNTSSSTSPKPLQPVSAGFRSSRGGPLSHTGSLPGPILSSRNASPLSSKRVSPVQARSNHSESSGSPTSPLESSRRRSSTASSLGVPGYPLSTAPVPIASSSESSSRHLDTVRRRSMGSGHSPSRSSKDGNVLGLGWGTGWETGSSTSKDKGKAKDVSGPPSPRITKTDPLASFPTSPPRIRRPSEFLNPSSESRKHPPGAGRPGHVPSLSTSASMISPLNPLPSPWMSGSDGQVLSPPHPHASEMTSGTSRSTEGAIRLNRVPANVRMAAELIKSNPGQQKSSDSSTATSTSVPTPNPSPAGSLPKDAAMPPPALRSLGHSPSMPTGRQSASGVDVPVPRPSLTVPATPRTSDRGHSPTQTTAPIDVGVQRRVSSSTLAPPSSFKGPQTSPSAAMRPRPSLPPDASGFGEPFASRAHKYRTSMHEQFKPGTSLMSDSSSQWSPVSTTESTTSISTGPPKAATGLGFNMPPVTALLTKTASTPSGRMTPDMHPVIRPKPTAAKGLHMDLAGLPGDAASHANMILQSRQAKLQKWRPGSAGSQTGQTVPAPAFGQRGGRDPSTSPKDTRRWDMPEGTGEDLPPFPSPTPMVPLNRVTTQPDLNDPSPKSQATESFPGPSSIVVPTGGFDMGRQNSASGTIGGIEWVDWYDCYKRYKEEKIRAEAEAARAKIPPIGENATDDGGTAQTSSTTSPTTAEGAIKLSDSYSSAMAAQDTSALALTPMTSRDEFGMPTGLRKRSMSIRSSLSAMDPSRSPSQKRTSIFERSRQASAGSARSTADSASSAVKRRKNLVTKMEGWWNAVKSNFSTDSPQLAQTGMALAPPHTRIPSAPASRRVSHNTSAPSVPPAPPVALLAPQPLGHRQPSGQSLRGATSNNELRSASGKFDAQHLQEAANIVSSTSADIAQIYRDVSRDSLSRPSMSSSGRKPSMVPEEPSPLPSRTTSSLEVRRKGGPNLRLDLEPSMFARPPQARATSSETAPAGRTTTAFSSSQSSSVPYMTAGLTPGAPRWDETPSPLFAVSTESNSPAVLKEDRPVAPGAETTVANVRRHIKHRLEAAKVACDHTLRKTIGIITRFVGEQKAQEQAEALQKAMEDQPRDYFSAMSESPLIDAEESEAEAGEAEEHHSRSRKTSASVPHSRRPSISRDRFASPSKRSSMLPGSPSRVRRRPSAAPRNVQTTQRLSRNLSLSLDRSVSASSSRSTSRSRSPLPSSTRGFLAGRSDEEAERGKEFLNALQDLIVFAQDILDMSVNTLIMRPSATSEIIQKLQSVGARWDNHDDWPGREWYVDILMAIANLNRVLDWWEAEKGFWNFDEEDGDEPILFVVKPKDESHFDNEFAAALTEPGSSPAASYFHVSEPPTTAVSLEVPSTESSGPGGTARQFVEPAKLPAADLKFLAEHAKSVNIVMELGLHGEEIQYVNDAILEVTGRERDDVIGLPINELLAPADAAVFADATQTLIEDDTNTCQLRFRFEVHEVEEVHPPRQPGPIYVELEGVGMLMRENEEPSHTMWVLRPVLAQQVQVDSIADAAFPKEGRFLTEGILCRICEREIVTWFFEKHNETCDAVHRLEADIYERNEMCRDLQQVVNDLKEELEAAIAIKDQSETGHAPSVIFYAFPESIVAGHDAEKLAGTHGVEVKKVDVAILDNIAEILSMAQEVETPSVQGDEADLPFNVQRYLSPASEDKLALITRWQRPQCTDRALQLLLAQVEDQLRRKQKAVARMQNTIRYSEKTRHEWEDKVNRMLGTSGETQSDSGGSDNDPISPIDLRSEPEGPETSPPAHRKIAPQARLPITQGHPQRPSSSYRESEAPSTLPSTPMYATTPATFPDPPTTEPLPSSELIPRTMTPESLQLPAPSEPLAVPERKAMRRTSSSQRFRDAPLSPRLPSAALPGRSNPSIKDFEIIKPISRGAFGSVYLAKKVATGDYFAIKALKKSDMIAKNQITNVKAERTILMNQASSPYVVKLFFSFQSKDYLYLVMEYLNGGDCATLIKTLGGLSEEWARNYTAEVVLGLEYLHTRNIVHRDIKPDNLLIDARGHLKLTDFGLSRIGLLNRQVGGLRPGYLRGTQLQSRQAAKSFSSTSSTDSPLLSPELMPAPPISSLSQSYFNTGDVITAEDSSGSESAGIIPRHMRTKSATLNAASPARDPFRFVGTPDYLSPETILGIGGDEHGVDWWALGVVLYEFLYGIPPFHADAPERVFDNIVSRRIDWHDDEMEVSAEARQLMDRLMCYDPAKRLGANGADEVKRHPFFAGIDWETITTAEASFIPTVTDPESTDYFDARGAVHALQDDDAPQVTKQDGRRRLVSASAAVSPIAHREMTEVIEDIRAQDDFGSFDFKNVPVLKQANDDVIRKLRTDSMAPMTQTLEGHTPGRRPRSLSSKVRERAVRKASDHTTSGGPPSPTTSTSSAASTPSRSSIPPSTPGSLPVAPQHFRRPSELNALDRVKSSEDSDLFRRSSAPGRVRTGSGSSMSDRSASMELWRQRRQSSLNAEHGSAEPTTAPILPPLESPESHASSYGIGDRERTLDVLIAEDNPISQKILETLLTRMGCRCICVEDGPQALAATMGSIHFDLIICDIHMPVVSGEQVARMIRSTNNHNQNTPIIACTSYEEHQDISEEGTLFSAILPKPVVKADLAKCLAKLGFVLSSGSSTHPSQEPSAIATA